MLRTSEECFAECDSIPECAAACFTTTQTPQCQKFKFGFEKRFNVLGWTAYVKPAVEEDMSNLGKLTDRFPNVKLNARFVNPYDSFDATTPSFCFKPCLESVMCAGASFTTDGRWETNCFLFKKNMIRESYEDVEYWISYAKSFTFPPPSIQSQQPMTGGGGVPTFVTINQITGNNINSNNQDTANVNSHNSNVGSQSSSLAVGNTIASNNAHTANLNSNNSNMENVSSLTAVGNSVGSHNAQTHNNMNSGNTGSGFNRPKTG
jgi:hypothetical protein